jgi:thiol-disulfide isomerase/thioredoxin
MKFLNRYFFAGVGTGCLLSVLLAVGTTFGFGYFAMRKFGGQGVANGGTSSLRAPEFPAADQLYVAHGEADWDWALSTLDRETVTLGDFQGEVVFLNLWATWCGPCKRELPHIQLLYDSLKAEGVEFLMVSKEDPEKVREFLEKEEYELPFYMIEGNPPEDLRSSAIPAAFIIDREGTVVFKELGARAWDDEAAIAFLRRLLSEEIER